jgi:hypothetical protein
MKMSSVDEYTEIEGVPVSARFAQDRVNRYGSVAGLDDEELADPAELERQVCIADWGSILDLPPPKRSPVKPNIDEYFGVDWGAFATVDFERHSGGFDKARYKADMLREELRDALIMMQVISGRLPKAKFQVLKYLRMGVIDLEHIESLDMYELGRLDLRARQLQAEIRRLQDASRAKASEQLAEVLR